MTFSCFYQKMFIPLISSICIVNHCDAYVYVHNKIRCKSGFTCQNKICIIGSQAHKRHNEQEGIPGGQCMLYC